MELSNILEALESTGQEKTASAVETPRTNRLESALDAALSMDKTASYQSQESPSEDLVKIAQKLADAEQLALIKEAEMYGAAVCDGFLARMNEHESNGVKVASFNGGADVDEVLLKQAMELGYRETQGQLEKVASEAFAQGYNDTLGQANEQHQAEKIASLALQQGYNDAIQAVNSQRQKTASDVAMIKQAAEDKAHQGYAHANRILASLAG